ncbi:MAG TPA: PstS family phosphate ABC transporter substrate-binding protein [Spirochaetota bacterium]|nr:PstS family phosphate ABC transporter substrate-binding protein [Spirochaetota bacterium]
MIRWICCVVLLAAGAAVMFSSGCTPRAQETITIYGSTTIEPITRKIAEAYMDNRAVDIVTACNGSHDGINKLINGGCDIADASAKISAAEMNTAKTKGVDIKEFPFARDLVVPIVHHDNPVKNLTKAQLRDIFSGKVRNWSDVGGTASEIDVAIRADTSGTHDVWNRIILGGRKEFTGAVAQASNSSVLAYVAANKNAVGYVSYAFLNSDVKMISIDGIRAEVKKGMKTEYPVTRTLYMYVDKKKLSPATRGFIVFILSNEGQRIVRESGFIPISGFSAP